jgi:Protein of unknown function (DUF2946)
MSRHSPCQPCKPRGLHALFVWLAIAAIIARSIVPSGYMPDFSRHHGLPRIVFCDGEDAGAPADHRGKANHDADHDKAHRHEGPCAFCVNSVFAATGAAPPVVAPATTGYVVRLAFSAFGLAHPRLYANASSRSPPRFS